MPLSRAQRVAAMIAGASLLLTTPAAAASTIPSAASISPWVAFSALGTQASGAALCGSSVAAAASAAQAAPAQPGCVLPVVDAVPPPPVVTGPPVAALPPVVGGGGLGISPLLLGLGLLTVVGLLALAHGDDDEDDGQSPD